MEGSKSASRLNDYITNFCTEKRKFVHDRIVYSNQKDKTKYTSIHIFSEYVKNPLGIVEEVPLVMLIKRKWIRSDYWSPHTIHKYSGLGQTIPFSLYDILHAENNHLTQLVFYIINDEKYYRTDCGMLIDFVEKYGTRFEDNWGADVVGISKDIFSVGI